MRSKINVYATTANGKLCWKIDYRDKDGVRVRRFFKTKSAAENEAAALNDQVTKSGEAWMAMTAQERHGVANVFAEAKAEGVTLPELWQAYRSQTLNVKPRVSRTLAQAIRETVEAKEAAQRRQVYVDGLESYLKAFARGREAMPVSQVTVSHIEQWFAERKEPPASRASNLGRLSAMFDLCYRRGYISENPCLRVERVTVVRKPPVILTPEQASRLLNFVFIQTPDYLPFLILVMMGCARPEETELIDWGMIDLDRGLLFISADISKVHQRRIVELDPTAVEWLKVGGELPVSAQNRKRQIRRMRALFGWEKWPQDLLRHTCASYLLAKHQDAGKVALWLGNSPGILLRHYRELVTRETADLFWSKRPKIIKRP